MRWVLIGLGLLLDIVGAIWLLQGLGIVGGSFMTGQSTWTFIGAVVLVLGNALILLGARQLLRRRVR